MNRGRTHLPPLPLLAAIGGSMLRLQRRSLAQDAAELLAHTVPAPRSEGLEHIPRHGAVLIVSNHYQRPGLWIGYAGALIACAVWERRGEEVRITVIDRVVVPLGARRVALPGTYWLFRRIAVTWDMVPMAVDDNNHGRRGAALRRLMGAVLPPPRGRGRVGVLFPEGHHGHSRHLSPALPGTGAFATLVSAGGVQLLPVGIYEDGATPVARFGAPFTLARDHALSRDEADRRARAEMMEHIMVLLPAHMHRPQTRQDAPPVSVR